MKIYLEVDGKCADIDIDDEIIEMRTNEKKPEFIANQLQPYIEAILGGFSEGDKDEWPIDEVYKKLDKQEFDCRRCALKGEETAINISERDFLLLKYNEHLVRGVDIKREGATYRGIPLNITT